MDHQLIKWYKKAILEHQLKFDELQVKFIEYLDGLLLHITKLSLKRSLVFFHKCNITYHHKNGLYVYGSVGRGKSMILAEFLRLIPNSKKIRWHFHEFMQFVQHQHSQINVVSPLKMIAKNLKKNYDIIYLDEFEILDIATAMLIGNLLQEVKKHSIFIVVSSNTKPANLYPNGLMRQRFLPTIDFIEQNFDEYNLDGGLDYRQQEQKQKSQQHFSKLIILPDIQQLSEATFEFYSKQLCQNLNLIYTYVINNKILIQHRKIMCVAMVESCAVWFDFNAICKDHRSVADYIELNKLFHLFMVSAIPQFNCNSSDFDKTQALRFAWLIDTLYDQQKSLIISSKFSLKELFINDESNLFTRTLSRLHEMIL